MLGRSVILDALSRRRTLVKQFHGFRSLSDTLNSHLPRYDHSALRLIVAIDTPTYVRHSALNNRLMVEHRGKGRERERERERYSPIDRCCATFSFNYSA